MTKLPTLLGNDPTFRRTIPLAKPLLPGFQVLTAEFEEILRNGILSKGQHVASLEDRVAEALEVKHAVAVSSCTTGLMLTYQALDLTGDVIVPSFTFMATVSALRWAGLRPVFADVDLETANLSLPAVRAMASTSLHAAGCRLASQPPYSCCKPGCSATRRVTCRSVAAGTWPTGITATVRRYLRYGDRASEPIATS